MKTITTWNTFVLFIDPDGKEQYISIQELAVIAASPHRTLSDQMDESALYQRIGGIFVQMQSPVDNSL